MDPTNAKEAPQAKFRVCVNVAMELGANEDLKVLLSEAINASQFNCITAS